MNRLNSCGCYYCCYRYSNPKNCCYYSARYYLIPKNFRCCDWSSEKMNGNESRLLSEPRPADTATNKLIRRSIDS